MSTPHLTELLDMTAIVDHVARLAVATGLDQSGIPVTDDKVTEALTSMRVVDRNQLRTECLRVAYPTARVIAEQAYAKALRDAAKEIQALHPGEVKASVEFLRAHANPFAEGQVLV